MRSSTWDKGKSSKIGFWGVSGGVFLGEEDKKNNSTDEVLMAVFIMSLKAGIEYGKEILKAGDTTINDLNDTLKKLLNQKGNE